MTEPFLSVQERFIKFSLLVLFSIPSIICALYVIYSVIKIASFRRRFQNQTLIILVFIILFNISFNIPTTFSFFVRGHVLLRSEVFCRLWQSIDYIFTASVLWCTAIFTLERYTFVFYPNYLRSQQQKLIFHYIPLILINLYLILFYMFIIFNDICNQKITFDNFLCGHQCLDRDSDIALFNWLFNILFPVFTVIFGSLILLTRILWTRRKMQRNLRNWSKNWKMSLQLLGIAVVYTVVWFPLAIVSFIPMDDEHNPLAYSVEDYLYFVTYICELFVPIVALLLSPELMQNLRRRLNVISVASVSARQYSVN